MLKKNEIITVLKAIPDPELNISVWELGLIYSVKVDKKGIVTIRMTLTSIGCPLFDLIQGPIVEKVGEIRGVSKVNVELTFEPPWTPDKMSDEAKASLGLF